MNLRECVINLVLFFCIFLHPLLAFSQENETNHCNDPESWAQWKELLQKNQSDDGIYTAYALRVGLCQMIEKKEIELDRATKIFEHYMGSLIEAKKALNDKEKPKGKI